MRNVTQAQCNHIAGDLNHRPRKRHRFDTPATLYH
jgi:IS30 family transposase